MKLIVGLGNPGKEYVHTRHNIGFLVINALSTKFHGGDWKTNKNLKSVVTDIEINEEKIILAKPVTFMNESGQAVGALQRFYKIDHKDIILIHDDIDLQFGKLRVRVGGSSGGHNGIKSIQQHTGQEATRFRIGVANDELRTHIPSVKFVLQKFNKDEQAKLPALIDESVNELTNYLENPEEYSKHLLHQ
jgi:PTH1 family peptidyl-tRNA hydrolase